MAASCCQSIPITPTRPSAPNKSWRRPALRIFHQPARPPLTTPRPTAIFVALARSVENNHEPAVPAANAAVTALQVRRRQMNSDQLKGMWRQLKGSVKERWGKLTDDDLDVIDGKHDQLIGKVQEKYGVAREVAQKQVEDWNAGLAHEDDVEKERRRAREADSDHRRKAS